MIKPHIFSFVLAFTLAETGGALEIFNFTMNPAKSTLVNDDGASLRFDPSRTPSVRFRIPPGSVIVVDSGQFLHQLTPVEGQTKRWTVCSFMAQSKDGSAVYCWG